MTPGEPGELDLPDLVRSLHAEVIYLGEIVEALTTKVESLALELSGYRESIDLKRDDWTKDDFQDLDRPALGPKGE